MEKQKTVKHFHGTPNPILQNEEEAMIAEVRKANNASSNPQVIGRNGEIPLRRFFNRYLPYTLRAVTGHFVSPSGKLSPQIDNIIIDARYPLLSEHPDDTVLAMLHSVIITIEVKTNLTNRGIEKMWRDAATIMSLAQELEGYGDEQWGAVATWGFAYGTQSSLDAIINNYQKYSDPWNTGMDIYLMRLNQSDQLSSKKLGLELHYEPDFASDDPDETKIVDWSATSMLKQTPLSDLYYSVVQHSYYTLSHRGHQFNDIGRHVMDYMSWTSYSWDDYDKELKGKGTA